jgi:hypothetical protein
MIQSGKTGWLVRLILAVCPIRVPVVMLLSIHRIIANPDAVIFFFKKGILFLKKKESVSIYA